MSDAKLTKKQLKALKHHQGRSQRKAAKNELLAELADPEYAKDEDEEPAKAESSKRKRTDKEIAEADADEGEAPKKKKRRKSIAKQEAAKRFKCFVGNLPFSATEEDIKKHFTHEDTEPAVRLQTEKADDKQETPAKSKGFAFVEFEKASGLQNALKLHHSTLSGRKINVELSAGGGGSGAVRKEKIETQRKKLNDQRDKRAKTAAEKKDIASKAKAESKKAAPPPSSKPKRTAAEKRASLPMRKPQLSGGNALKLG